MARKRNYEGVPVPYRFNLDYVQPGGPMPERIARVKVGHGAWREPSGPIEPGRPPVTGRRHIDAAIRHKRHNAVSKALTREAYVGRADLQPPPLTKPRSSGDYGECPDEQELPWHLRQKRKP